MKRFALPAVLIGLMMAAVACEKKFNVAPSSMQLPTATPTVTRTSTPAPTSTATFTPSSTATLTLTPSPTFTLTNTAIPSATPTPTPALTDTDTPTVTDTDTATPTATDTDTPVGTPTFTATFVCTVAVVNPISYNELEPLGVGGSTTGTNDSCATAENVGTVSTGNSLVITGSLFSTGGGTLDLTKDQDYYLFTVGSNGNYLIDVDCYSSGADSNLIDLAIFDTSCTYLTQSGAMQPVAELNGTGLTAGAQYILTVLASNGTAPVPYHITITPP